MAKEIYKGSVFQFEDGTYFTGDKENPKTPDLQEAKIYTGTTTFFDSIMEASGFEKGKLVGVSFETTNLKKLN